MQIIPKSLKIGAFWTIGVGLLSACTQMQPSPADQVQQVRAKVGDKADLPKVSKAKSQIESRFLCEKEKVVRVMYPKKNTKNAKSERITVSFNGLTHTLSPVVAKNGKKYTNIRWTWWELRSGKAYLMENPQKILAENCLKQS